jgi:hypothetical protein
MVVQEMLLKQVEVEEQQVKLVKIEMRDVVQAKQVEAALNLQVVQVVLVKVEQQHQVANFKEVMEGAKLTAEVEAVDIMEAEAVDIQKVHLLWEVEAVVQDILIHHT